MADESRFDFCPLCGALARDGVCQSCGHKDQKVIDEIEAKRQVQAMQQPMYNGQPYAGQQAFYSQQQNVQQPYAWQATYSVMPPEQPRKKSSLWIVILLLALVLVMTIAVIFIGVRSIIKDSEDRRVEEVTGDVDEDESDAFFDDEETDSAEPEETEGIVEETDSEETASDETAIDLEDYVHDKYDVTESNLSESGQDTSLPYYSGPYNAVADNLSYQVEFVEEVFYSEDKPIYMCIEYPQIVSGLEEYNDYINEVLYYEYGYYETLFTEEFGPLMDGEGDAFTCYVDSFVTYMDEDILSIVFKEELFMQLGSDSFDMLDFYCVNIDLQTGMVMENTEILHLDEAFAIDFRQREINENGDAALTHYTDQEILEMLRDPGQLVAFYTPYGMEVGLNLEDIIVYVMYDDYVHFLNSY